MHSICDHILETIHLGRSKICGNTQLKTLDFFNEINFLHIVVKQLLSFCSCKISHP